MTMFVSRCMNLTRNVHRVEIATCRIWLIHYICVARAEARGLAVVTCLMTNLDVGFFVLF
jgi:hypothetical protein